MKYILSLDQGTTSSRAILFDENFNVKSKAQKEFAQVYPYAGWVEHEPFKILSSQIDVAKKAINDSKIEVSDILAIGITNQRETTIVWNKETGEPIYNAIVWQCRRTSEYCDELKNRGYSELIKDKTGLVLDAYFSATKIKWILDNVEGARTLASEGKLLFGTVDTWLIWNLTAGAVHATDVTNASRTMLFNIHTLTWDKDILDLFEIPESMLPEVRNNMDDFGKTDGQFFGGENIPISSVAGDQHSALFGQMCLSEGSIKNTYGTGCFMLMNTGGNIVKSYNGLLSTIAWKIGSETTYALEGSVFNAGSSIQWLRDELRLVYDSAQSEYYANMVDDTNGVVVVPAFTGLGAPHWDMYARGAIFGLTRGTKREHIVRATLESIAYQVKDIVGIMAEESGIKIKYLKVDGGASANDFLMQFQSDILNANVKRPKQLETTALGVAYFAAMKHDLYSVEDIFKMYSIDKEFHPSKDIEWIAFHYSKWQKAVGRSLEWEK